MIHTGHSLGRIKKTRLLAEGNKEIEINKRYNIDYRILNEERILKEADLIVTSTNQEIEKQYRKLLAAIVSRSESNQAIMKSFGRYERILRLKILWLHVK